MPEWIWNNYARTRRWIRLLAAKVASAARGAKEDRVVLEEVVQAEAEPVALEVGAADLAAAEGVVEEAAAAEVVAVVSVAAGSATSATSSPISLTALSSGPAETAR